MIGLSTIDSEICMDGVREELDLSQKLMDIQEELSQAEDHLDLFQIESRLNSISRTINLFSGKLEYVDMLDEKKINRLSTQICDIRRSITKKYIDLLKAHFKNAEDYFYNMSFPAKRSDDKYLNVSAGSVIASAILEKMQQHGSVMQQDQLNQLEDMVYRTNKAFLRAQVHFMMNDPDFAGLSDGEYFKNHFIRLEEMYLPQLRKEIAHSF